MHDLLATLVHLHPMALHARAGDAAKRQASAAWELAACLVAMEKSEYFREFDCANVVEYGERHLGLGPCKVLELLRGGRVLERFPKLSEACREGRLCWSKLREVGRAVESETEERWLAFAVGHTTREVERAVSVSAGQFRREREAGARAEGEGARGVSVACAAPSGSASSALDLEMVVPVAPGDELASPSPTAVSGAVSSVPAPVESVPTGSGPAMSGSVQLSAPAPAAQAPLPPPAPVPPRFVKVELFLTPDQFAIWDTAVDRVRSQKSRRVSKEVALEVVARHFLAGGDSRTRTSHPVVLRSDPATGSTWYETSRGTLPASAEATEDALARERGVFVVEAEPERPKVATVPQETEAEQVHLHAAPQEPEEDAHQREVPVEATVCGERKEGGSEAREASADLQLVTPEHPRPALPRRTPIPSALRRAALASADYRCQRCGGAARLEVDHVTAVCEGGADLRLQVLCHDCHALKHADDFAADPRYIRGRAEGVARWKPKRKELVSSE